MKKISALFLVFILVFALAGCGTTAGEETATTETVTLSHEDQVAELVQWTIINILNKNSTERYASAYLYEDVKEEVESYISTLPSNLAPTYFSVNLISPDVFVINISF